jgi:hypothetical protein
MTPQEELAALRRLVELEAKARPTFEQRLAAQPAIDPTADMSVAEKLLAGAGKGFVDVGRGVQQVFGGDQELQALIDEQARLDKPLLATGAGLTGNIIGGAAVLAPTFAIPGAGTVAGSTMLGAIGGGLQPVTSEQNRVTNIATGGLFGATGQALGNLAPRALSAATAPFREGGRARIIAETLREFANDPDAIARAAANRVPGVEMTTAEATRDPGLAILQRVAQSQNPAFGAELAAQELRNIAASANVVRDIAQTPRAMAQAVSAREAAAAPYYEIARNTTVRADEDLARLMRRPEIADAFRQAQQNAANAGTAVPGNFYQPARRVPEGLSGMREVPEQFGEVSGETLHQMKMALDASLSSGPQRGIAGANAIAVRSARDDFLNWIEDRIPAYQTARETFAEGSRPINQMETGNELIRRMIGSAQEVSGYDPTLVKTESFATALRNLDDVVRSATGRNELSADVLTPAQRQSLLDVNDYLSNRQFVQNVAKPPGSNTAQNLAGQNFMRSIAGPLGLPSGFLESQVSRLLSATMSPGFAPYEQNLQRELAAALLTPQTASGALEAGIPSGASPALLEAYTRALGALSVGAGTSGQ